MTQDRPAQAAAHFRTGRKAAGRAPSGGASVADPGAAAAEQNRQHMQKDGQAAVAANSPGPQETAPARPAAKPAAKPTVKTAAKPAAKAPAKTAAAPAAPAASKRKRKLSKWRSRAKAVQAELEALKAQPPAYPVARPAQLRPRHLGLMASFEIGRASCRERV